MAVPTLFIGIWMSRIERIPEDMPFTIWLGEPLLFKFAQWSIWGTIADGYTLNMHPMAFGAWFGLIATALNLFPVAQLDGGHISYAVFGNRSVKLTYAMIVAAVVVYQVLSNDVREHLPEYATLKAMGYSTARLAAIVVEQSLIYMVISFFVGVLIAIIVYKATQELAGIPMKMTMENLGLTLLLAIVVGVSTGLLTIGRLRRAAPAELF